MVNKQIKAMSLKAKMGVLLDDLNLVSRTEVGQLTTACNSNSRVSDTTSGL